VGVVRRKRRGAGQQEGDGKVGQAKNGLRGEQTYVRRELGLLCAHIHPVAVVARVL